MGYNMYMYDISGDVPEDNDDDSLLGAEPSQATIHQSDDIELMMMWQADPCAGCG